MRMNRWTNRSCVESACMRRGDTILIYHCPSCQLSYCVRCQRSHQNDTQVTRAVLLIHGMGSDEGDGFPAYLHGRNGAVRGGTGWKRARQWICDSRSRVLAIRVLAAALSRHEVSGAGKKINWCKSSDLRHSILTEKSFNGWYLNEPPLKVLLST